MRGNDPRFDWRRLPLRIRNATRGLRMNAARREISEDVWRRRGGDDWVSGYWSDTESPRRDCIIQALRDTFAAPASVYDVGCNAGPTLRRIAGEFPGCRLSGFDINSEAIAGARKGFADLGVAADLSIGTFYEVLPATPDNSADIVVSSFALAYVPPAHLPEVLAHMIRIAVRGVVLAEPHAFGMGRRAGTLTVPWYDWRHDYAATLLEVGVSSDQIAVSDIPDPGSPDAGLLVADLR